MGPAHRIPRLVMRAAVAAAPALGWTFNSEGEMRAAIADGVDFAVTDRPLALLALINATRGRTACDAGGGG